MPDWIDEAVSNLANHGFFERSECGGAAELIREAYQNRPQENTPLPEGCVPSGPEGFGSLVRETGIGSQCLGPGISSQALGGPPDGMNEPLPGKGFGDGQ